MYREVLIIDHCSPGESTSFKPSPLYRGSRYRRSLRGTRAFWCTHASSIIKNLTKNLAILSTCRVSLPTDCWIGRLVPSNIISSNSDNLYRNTEAILLSQKAFTYSSERTAIEVNCIFSAIFFVFADFVFIGYKNMRVGTWYINNIIPDLEDKGR